MEQRLWPRITLGSRRLSFNDFAASRIVPNESLSGDVGARDNLQLHITQNETFGAVSLAPRFDTFAGNNRESFLQGSLHFFTSCCPFARWESLAFEGELSALRARRV